MKRNSLLAHQYRSIIGKSVGIASVLLGAWYSYGQPVFSDDFESYPDQAALNVVWFNNSAAVSGSLIPPPPADGLILTNSRSLVPPSTGTKAGATRWAHDRSRVTLSTGDPLGIPANTPAMFTVYMWRNSISPTVGQTRMHVVMAATDFGASSMGIGWFNNATAVVDGTADVFDTTTFQGKHNGAGGNVFFNLKNPGCPRRTIGWHKFDVEMLPDGSTRYYVDNVLGRTITNAAFNWTYLIAGFGTTSSVPGVPGEEVDFDGFFVTTNNPSITTQPTNQLVAANATATFNVAATAPGSYPITGYQWFFATNLSDTAIYSTNYKALSGATSATLAINNANLTNQGLYFVIVSNADSFIGSAAARLVITAPSISSQTSTSAPLQGANFTLTATAGGSLPLSYQWFKAGSPIAGATTNSYSKTGVGVTDGGIYTLRVTNTFASVTSAPITVTIITNPYPTAMNLLWSKLPGDYPWLGAGNAARGLAYNIPSNHVLVASTTGGNLVHVLNGDDGSYLYDLDAGIGVIGGGTRLVNMIGAADDGAIYVCNLTLDAGAAAFQIYRYADDAPGTVPTIAYTGDPVAGTLERWGDTMVVRGAGLDTQILVGSRLGTNVCIFTTTDGATFNANPVGANIGAGDVGLGLAFGQGNTFWGKADDGITNALYHLSFNLVGGTATTLNRYTNFAKGAANIGTSPAGNVLAAIEIATPNDLRLYDITDLNNDPVSLDWEFFTPNVVGFSVGNVQFGNNRVYALNSNNGIVAAQIGWPQLTFSQSGANLTLNWVGLYKLQSATTVTGPYGNVFTSPAAGSYTTNSTGQLFFRLTYP